MLENINKNKNKIWFLEIINIKIRNFDINPKRGGTPANDNKIITIKMVINGKLPKNFNSFNDLRYFISNKKKIKNIFINVNI